MTDVQQRRLERAARVDPTDGTVADALLLSLERSGVQVRAPLHERLAAAFLHELRRRCPIIVDPRPGSATIGGDIFTREGLARAIERQQERVKNGHALVALEHSQDARRVPVFERAAYRVTNLVQDPETGYTRMSVEALPTASAAFVRAAGIALTVSWYLHLWGGTFSSVDGSIIDCQIAGFAVTVSRLGPPPQLSSDISDPPTGDARTHTRPWSVEGAPPL